MEQSDSLGGGYLEWQCVGSYLRCCEVTFTTE